MRIGISTSVVDRGRTGISRYLLSLVRAFLPHCQSHQFKLFVLEEDVPLFEFAKGPMEIVTVDEKYRPPVKNILWHQTDLPRLARRHQLDVLHVPSYRRLVWSRPCALVATIHDLAPFQVRGKYDWKRMFYGRVVARRLARRQNRVIAISRNTASDLKRFFGLPEHRIRVVHNGLDHDRFFPAFRECRGVAQREKPPFFLYVARLEHPGKNHVRLIDAFNRFKSATGSNWQLVFAGADWTDAAVIHHAARSSPHAIDIRSLGFVGDDALPSLYRTAGAFVFPSLYEGFGLPMLEAMACGCPVLASARGSLVELAGDAALLVDPEDVEAMAGQLGAIAGDRELREKLRALGLQWTRRFDWSKTASQTLRVYEQAARH